MKKGIKEELFALSQTIHWKLYFEEGGRLATLI